MPAHFIKLISSKDARSTHMVGHLFVVILKHRKAVFEIAYKQVLHPLKLMKDTGCPRVQSAVQMCVIKCEHKCQLFLE